MSVSRSALIAVALALVVVAGGCGDPLADKLESSGSQPYSDDDPSLVDPDAPTTTPAPPSTVPPTTVPATTAPATTAPPATAAPDGPPLPVELVAAANRVCAAVKLSMLPAVPEGEADYPQFHAETAVYLQEMADGLRPLAQSAGADRLRTAVVALDEAAAAFREEGEAHAAGDEGAATAANGRGVEAMERALVIFNRADGPGRCGNGEPVPVG